jgi:hypothetical protein
MDYGNNGGNFGGGGGIRAGKPRLFRRADVRL